MEHNQVLLLAYNRIKSIESNEGVSVFPQQKQMNVTHLGSTQEMLEPQSVPAMLDFLNFRIQQLENRRYLLLEMQCFRRRLKGVGDETREETVNTEDSDRLCELDTIQKELEVLLGKKEELQELESNSKLSHVPQGQQELCPTSHEAEIPSGEIFVLTPLEETCGSDTLEQNTVTETTTERETSPVIPVDKLGREADVTQCPRCNEVVFTETRKKVGEAVCLASCVCAMVGCAAGCCLIPFCLDRLKDVHHKCPQCQAHLHTYRPF